MTIMTLRSLFVLSLAGAALSASGQLPASVQSAQDDALDRLSGVQPGVRILKNAAKIDRVYGPVFGAGADAKDAFQSFMSAYSAIFAPGDARFEFKGA